MTRNRLLLPANFILFIVNGMAASYWLVDAHNLLYASVAGLATASSVVGIRWSLSVPVSNR